MNGAFIAKALIVLVVFPVVVHAIFTAGTMLVGFILPSVLALADDWSATLGKGVVGAMFLAAVAGSWGVCRRLWPTTMAR